MAPAGQKTERGVKLWRAMATPLATMAPTASYTQNMVFPTQKHEMSAPVRLRAGKLGAARPALG